MAPPLELYNSPVNAITLRSLSDPLRSVPITLRSLRSLSDPLRSVPITPIHSDHSDHSPIPLRYTPTSSDTLRSAPIHSDQLRSLRPARSTTSEGALPANVQVAPPRGGLSARRSALAGRCAVVSVTACPRLADGAVTGVFSGGDRYVPLS